MNPRRDGHPDERGGNRAERDGGARQPPPKRKRGNEVERAAQADGAADRPGREGNGGQVKQREDFFPSSQSADVPPDPAAPAEAAGDSQAMDDEPSRKRQAREDERDRDMTAEGNVEHVEGI